MQSRRPGKGALKAEAEAAVGEEEVGAAEAVKGSVAEAADLVAAEGEQAAGLRAGSSRPREHAGVPEASPVAP